MNTKAAMSYEGETIEVECQNEPNRHVASSPRRFYRIELDMLRFFAFLAVFLHHGIYQLSPIASKCGGFGLSLFFLLSAFLITELLQREKASTETVSIKDFYIRRSLRIWPLYYAFLLFTYLLGYLYPSHRVQWGYYISFALMFGNVYIGRNGFPNNPSAFLWSISIEEQFYLFWPLLNRYCSRRTLGRIALGAFPIAGTAVLILCLRQASPNIGIWTSTFVQLQIFACGVLLSLILQGSVPRLSVSSRIALLVVGIVFWSTAAAWAGVVDHDQTSAFKVVIGYYLVCAGCIALFLSAYGIEGRRIPRPLAFLGKVSYGLYVFHQLCLEVSAYVLNHLPPTNSITHHVRYGVGHIALGFTLSVAAATLSYHFFEKPFLRLKESFAVIQSRSA